MLVLSRKAHEEIVVPQLGIRVRVLRISGGRVKLAIDAPRSISIVRAEIAGNREESRALKTFTTTDRQSMSVG